MGYYDDHHMNRRLKSKRGWLLPTLVGLVLGIVLIILALPTLVKANFLPYEISVQDVDDENVEQDDAGDQGEGESKSVSVDISSQATEVVQGVSNTVVGVVNIQQSQNIFGQSSERDDEQAGTGSGVIYKVQDDRAYIVTNYHVIQGASTVEIVFADEEQVEAEVVGGDVYTDLAVLTVDASNVEETIEFGNSDELNVGEPVLAIGNPLGLQFAGSVTQGIISGKERLIPQDLNQDGRPDWQAEVLQTDAAINPGNSGGALVNMEGQLIGINSLKIGAAQVEGLGFAIPIDYARPVIDQLEENGAVSRSYLGITPYSLSDVAQYHWQNTLDLPDDVESGVIVDAVENVSPADQAGLEQYDVIVELNGETITNVLELRQYLYNETEPGEELTITYYRDGELQETTATLSAQEF
ncbi:serine protease [Halalkalibacillus sediminis]|uniref:Serine protease n=1 Tax=Halalkalibacillus sediminis TaxID=2018042 RepID=A0A2I0QSS9_9BACI|nr:trypsin-like peptidase domain-containing protein [Halalkalibacillus sediminis]PKR77405.1 serine protease [Halalkalibacillus sediminis]